MFISSVRRFFGLTGEPARPQPRRATFRPRLEALERRLVLSAALHVGVGAGEYHTIQAAVTAAHPGDTILVDLGTYQEQVLIPAGKDGLTLKSVKPLAAVIQAPAVLAYDGAVVEDDGAQNLTIDGFTIKGSNNSSPDQLFGILVDGGGSATITHNRVTAVRNDPLSGNQEGVGIQVGNNLEGQSGSAVISQNTIDDYQKGGVVVEHTGSSAQIDHNTVVGVGPTGVIAQNGIQISAGATAVVSHNDVSGNVYTPQTVVSTGILLFNPGTVTVDHNTVHDNDVGVYAWVTIPASAVIDVDHNQISNSTVDGIDLNGTTGALVSHNEVSTSGTDGIALFDSATNNTIDHNNSTNNGHDGVFVELGSSGNQISHNGLRGNGMYDAEDDSSGSGTVGTANFWDNNQGKTENRPGLLK